MIELDLVTNLRNRVGLREYFLEAQSQPVTQVSFLLIDIDSLIAFNDHYGVIAGDEFLKTIAQIIIEIITPSRELFRVYGDEFATLIVDLSPPEVIELAEAICQKIKATFQHTQVRRLKGFTDFRHPIYVEVTPTVSCAIAFFPQQGKDLDSLFIFADSLLYEQAKPLGGNRVAVAQFSPLPMTSWC